MSPAAELVRLEAETASGDWTLLALLWVRLEGASARPVPGEGAPPLRLETATAAARNLAVAEPGQRLVGPGEPWRVVFVARPEPGRMVLSLERLL